ncbi:hypothetical protein KRR40_13740 [Niabella defluvii]|nr:hypothetical protein KRR40_13740 [Niabella sp. I65]
MSVVNEGDAVSNVVTAAGEDNSRFYFLVGIGVLALVAIAVAWGMSVKKRKRGCSPFRLSLRQLAKLLESVRRGFLWTKHYSLPSKRYMKPVAHSARC